MQKTPIHLLAAGMFFFYCLTSSSLSMAAGGRIVNDVEITTTPSGAEIHIFFDDLFQYVTHAPLTKSDELQIQLQPISSSLSNLETLAHVKNVPWQPVEGVPILEIAYDGSSLRNASRISASTRPIIRIRFERAVEYAVQGAPDLRSLVILLPSLRSSPQIPPAAPPKVIEPRQTKKIKDSKLQIPAQARYVLQLHSSKTDLPREQLPSHPLLDQYILYRTTAVVDGATWYRWRLGFFLSEEETSQKMRELQQAFPQSWVVKIPDAEHSKYYQSTAEVFKTPPPEKELSPGRQTRPLAPDRLTAMLDEGKQVMTAGDYRRAIQIYSRILQHPDPQLQKEALEYLALARERNGQLAHAKALYEEYLTLYPNDPGALRVEQRLASLLSSRAQPKNALRKERTISEEKTWDTEFFGNISEFYDYDESRTNGESYTNTNALTSDADLNLRLRSKDFDFETSFVGSNTNDFSEQADDEARVSQLYADVLDKKRDLSLRVGRQSENSGGILGRFDGSLAGYRVTPTIKINAVLGHPVASTTQTKIDTDRQFWGVNFDFGTYASHWDYNVFYIEQDVDGLLDRQAIGGEARYFDPRLSLFTLADYDIYIDKLNSFLAVGSVTVLEDTMLRGTYDFRRSNFLSASSALQGQEVERIADLLLLTTEDEIRQLAEERNADQTLISFGATKPLNLHWQIDGEISRSEFSDTLDLDRITSIPGTVDYYYNVQMIGNSLTKEGDIAIFSLRYDDTESSDTIYLTADARYPITRDFRVSPRLRWDFRDSQNGAKRTRWSPLVRFDYRITRRLRFEFDLGAEVTRQETATGDMTETWRHFAALGFRLTY